MLTFSRHKLPCENFLGKAVHPVLVTTLVLRKVLSDDTRGIYVQAVRVEINAPKLAHVFLSAYKTNLERVLDDPTQGTKSIFINLGHTSQESQAHEQPT